MRNLSGGGLLLYHTFMSNVYFYLPAVRLAVLFVIVIGRLCSILPARREARRFFIR